MQIGKVVGTIVATKKDEKLDGLRLQLVEYVDIDGRPNGGIVTAVDSVQSGTGDIVLVAAGSSARLTSTTDGRPVDSVIMAIVDEIEIGGKYRYQKN